MAGRRPRPEGALFGYLLFSYYYFSVQLFHSWIPAPPPFRLSEPDTVILIASNVAAWWGQRGVRRNARGQIVLGLGIAALLGIAFIVVEVFEWRSKPFSLGSGPYGSLFYTVTGFHMAHVLAGVLMLLLTTIWAALGYFDTRRNAPVLIVTTYWHFVDIVWLTVFTTFYITPYLW